MNIVKKLITIFIVLQVFINASQAQDQIVYLDLDKVISNTKAGNVILNKLEKSKNTALSKFEKKEKGKLHVKSGIENSCLHISTKSSKQGPVDFQEKMS